MLRTQATQPWRGAEPGLYQSRHLRHRQRFQYDAAPCNAIEICRSNRTLELVEVGRLESRDEKDVVVGIVEVGG